MQSYIALIRKESDSDYGIDFPDFPGCISAGSDLDEARKNAQEALSGHVQLMAEQGYALPEPSSLEAIMNDKINEGAVAFLVTVNTPNTKTKRLNITLPEKLVQDADAYAASHGDTRSGLIAKSLEQVVYTTQ